MTGRNWENRWKQETLWVWTQNPGKQGLFPPCGSWLPAGHVVTFPDSPGGSSRLLMAVSISVQNGGWLWGQELVAKRINAGQEPSRDILRCLHGDRKQTENPRGCWVIMRSLTPLPRQMPKRKTQKNLVVELNSTTFFYLFIFNQMQSISFCV